MLLAVPALLVVAVYFLHVGPHHLGLGGYRLDLDVYRIGARTWLDGGALYGPMPLTQVGIGLPFTYPPVAAVLFAPLALMSYPAANTLLTAATIVGVLGTLVLFLRSVDVGGRRLATIALAALPLALLLEPVRATLSFGQVNILLMVLVALDCLLPRTPWPRGLLIGIAAAVKLTPAGFVLFLLLVPAARRDRMRTLITATAAFLMTTGLGFVLAPADSREYWGSVLFDTGRIGGAAYAGNQSITGVLARLDLEGVPRLGLWLLLSGVVIGLAARGMRRAFAAGQPALALVLNALAVLLVSPVSWTHHWVWLVPGLLVLGVLGMRSRSRVQLGFAVAGTLLLALSPLWWLPRSDDRELSWAPWQHVVGSSYVVFAVMLLAAAAFGTSLFRAASPDRELSREGVEVRGTGRLIEVDVTDTATRIAARYEDAGEAALAPP